VARCDFDRCRIFGPAAFAAAAYDRKLQRDADEIPAISTRQRNPRPRHPKNQARR
jgi:hypothetical protein